MLTSVIWLCEKSVTILSREAVFRKICHGFCHGKSMKIRVYIDQRKKDLGESAWCVELKIGKKRKRKYLSSREIAYEYKRELEKPFIEGYHEESEPNAILLSTALTNHLDNLSDLGARPITITSRRTKCNHFVRWMKDARLSKVTRQIFKEYILLGNTETTRKTTRSEVGGFLNWCHESDLTKTHFYKVKWESKFEDEELIGILTPEETAELLSKTMDRYKVATALSLFAGIRPYELDRLKWELFYPEKNLIIIEGKSSKTRKNRKLTDLPPNLWDWIGKYKKHCLGKIGPLNRYRVFAKNRKKAIVSSGIIYPHDGARHSFGTYGYFYGGKSWAMRCMGHSNEKVFNKHYLNTGVGPEEANDFFKICP